MKRFIAVVSHQPNNYTKLQYDASSCVLDMTYGETRVPILPLMNAVVEEGETIEVILIANEGKNEKNNPDQRSAFERNLNWTLEEITDWAKTKNVTLKGLDAPICRDESSNMREMFSLFDDMITRVENNYHKDDLFYADITFGTKPMTVVIINTLRYIRSIKKNAVEIVYGQVYRWPMRDQNGQKILDKDRKVCFHIEGEMQELSSMFYMDSLISKVGGMKIPNPEKVVHWSLRSAIGDEGGDDDDND